MDLFQTTRTRIAALTALALAFIVVIGLHAADTGAARGGPALTLDQERGKIVFGQSKRLSGTLSGVGDPGGQTITLLANPFPYGGESAVDTTTTDAQGEFSFRAEPEFNTRYRVSYDGGLLGGTAASEVEQVFVYASGDTDVGLDPRQRFVVADFFLRYSPNVEPDPLIGKPVFWYFQKTTQERAKRVVRSKFRERSGGGVKTSTRYRLPRGRRAYRFIFFPCFEAPRGDVGVGDRRPNRCPKRIRARSRDRTYAP